MNEEFYAMLPDAIGTVAYNWKAPKKQISQVEEQAFIDNYTRESMYVLLNQARYDNGEIVPPEVKFMNARAEARKLLDETGPDTIIKRETLQVGNKECLDLVLKLQKSPNFKGWVNPGLINLYIQTTQKLLTSC